MATAFEDYVTARGAALVRFARFLGNDEHRAEDPMQEALARGYLGWDHIARGDEPDV